MTAPVLTRDGIAEAIRSEQATLTSLIAGINDTDWANRTRNDGWTIHDLVGHIADGLFGMNMLLRNELPPGPIDMDQVNAYRHQQNLPLTRAEIETKLGQAFDAILATVDTISDLAAPGPFGQTLGDWLATIVPHAAEHRSEIEQALKA